MKRIAVLGSTGSIGTNTLEVIANFPSRFKVIGLTAGGNLELFRLQIERFQPKIVAMRQEEKAGELKKLFPRELKVYSGIEGISQVASSEDVDMVILGIPGSEALIPFLSAIESGKQIALANKEALVMAGEVLMHKIKKSKAMLIPVDSEQSAIFQCLKNQNKERLKKIYLTASGGPLAELPLKSLRKVSVRQALRHPKWKMGKKITIDSATLMNKGLEVIEARWLFEIEVKRIAVLVHPEAIIHSMVEFVDGTILALLGPTDMRLPIQYALSYPERWPTNLKRIDFLNLRTLSFEPPDYRKFPCLSLAYEAAFKGGSAPCVLNVANEEAVNLFLEGRIDFMEIPQIIEKVLTAHSFCTHPTLEEVLELDRWTREETRRLMKGR